MSFAVRITLLCVSILLAITSCKSKKQVVTKTKEGTSKQYVKLSRKLNLQVEKGDNIKLYSYIADWLGTSHKIGGCDKKGVDCSCFVRMLFENIYNVKLARTATEMSNQAKGIAKEKLNEGDLVFFNINSSKPSHVGIYLKEGWFAHVSTKRGVMINNLSEPYYNKYYTGAGSRKHLDNTR